MSALPRLDVRRHRHRAGHSRRLVAHETALEVRLARLLQDAGTEIARQQRDHGAQARETALNLLPARLRQVLRPALITTARDFAAGLQEQAKSALRRETKAFETLDGALADWVDIHTGTRIAQIARSTRSAVQEQVRRAIEEGWSQDELAAAIEEATGGELAGERARRIARTETHTAANAGQFIAAQTSPLEYTKEWLATEDDRTRQDHADANGQRVPMLADFILGGGSPSQGGRFFQAADGAWLPNRRPMLTRDGGIVAVEHDPTSSKLGPGMVAMLYPGDPAAPPGQIINCRCTCLYAPVVDQTWPEPAPMDEGDGLPPLTDEEYLDLALPPRKPRRLPPPL